MKLGTGLRREGFLLGLVGLLACLLCAAPAGAAPGELDQGFSRDGVLRLPADPSAQNAEDRIEIDSAGRYVVLATSDGGVSRVLRFQRDGALDASFGSGGSAAAPAGTWHDLALRPDGGIVLAGTSGHDFAVARLTADGRPDPAFGDGGIASFHVDPTLQVASDKTVEGSFERLELDGEGRIVAVGDVRAYFTGEETGYFHLGSVVARFTPAGALDPGFGPGGAGFLDLARTLPKRFDFSNLGSLAIQPDGKVLVGGNVEDDLLVARLTTAGAFDASFSGNGLARSRYDTVVSEGELLHGGGALALLLQKSGRIIAVGGEVLVAFRPNGELDPSFGPRETDGIAPIENTYTTNLRLDPAEAALDGKGRILVAGNAYTLTAVARFYPNGEHDPRFAGDGLAHVNLSKVYLDSDTPEERATDLALEPDGAAVTAGFAYAGKRSRPALTRWHGGDGRRASCHGRPAVLQGTPGDDRLSAPGPIVAFGGDDEVHSWYGLVCAGAGDDEVTGGSVGTTYGGAGDDEIVGGSRAYGGAGDDVIRSRRGYEYRNVYYGGPGDDLLSGGRGPDLLFGGAGMDRLIGGRGEDRLFGGPGADVESGGGGGRKTVYRARGKDGFRIQLVVRRHQITGVHLRARMHCGKRNGGSVFWNTNHAGIRIHPDGRFRYANGFDTEEGTDETLLAGRVMPGRIVGSYRRFERTVSEACRTGTRRHPQIEFAARRARR